MGGKLSRPAACLKPAALRTECVRAEHLCSTQDLEVIKTALVDKGGPMVTEMIARDNIKLV